MSRLRARAIVLSASLLSLSLAGCAGSGSNGPVVEGSAPAYHVVCEITKQDRAFNTADGVVSSPAVERHEFTVANRNQVRGRLEEMGLATAEKPCSRLDVQPVQP